MHRVELFYDILVKKDIKEFTFKEALKIFEGYKKSEVSNTLVSLQKHGTIKGNKVVRGRKLYTFYPDNKITKLTKENKVKVDHIENAVDSIAALASELHKSKECLIQIKNIIDSYLQE